MLMKAWTCEQITEEFVGCTNLQQILKVANESAWKSNSVICEIQVNHQFLSEEDEIEKGDMPISDISHLSINTQTTDELVKNSVNSYLQLIPQIKAVALTCSEGFREYNVQEGQKLFTEVLDGCRWMTDALFLLKGSLKQRNGFMELGPEWEDLESQYSSVVNELVTAFEANDTLLLADVLEYELLNNLDGWVGVFEKIDHKMDVNSL